MSDETTSDSKMSWIIDSSILSSTYVEWQYDIKHLCQKVLHHTHSFNYKYLCLTVSTAERLSWQDTSSDKNKTKQEKKFLFRNGKKIIKREKNLLSWQLQLAVVISYGATRLRFHSLSLLFLFSLRCIFQHMDKHAWLHAHPTLLPLNFCLSDWTKTTRKSVCVCVVFVQSERERERERD